MNLSYPRGWSTFPR